MTQSAWTNAPKRVEPPEDATASLRQTSNAPTPVYQPPYEEHAFIEEYQPSKNQNEEETR